MAQLIATSGNDVFYKQLDNLLLKINVADLESDLLGVKMKKKMAAIICLLALH